MSSVFSSKLNQLLITLALAGAVLALGAYSYSLMKQVSEWGGPVTINVSGTGEVTAIPDVAQFSFSVRAEGADAAEAQSKSAESINAIMAYLAESGVAEKDIKTSGYNLNPKYKFESKPCLLGAYCPPGNQVQDGFEVYQTVEVKVRDMDKSGELLSGVGQKGATDISGLNFTIDDEDAIKAEARKLAIADAQAQAEVLAENLGVKLVKMTNYYEDNPTSPYYGGAMMDSAVKMESSYRAPEIAVGESKTTSKVMITYEVK